VNQPFTAWTPRYGGHVKCLKFVIDVVSSFFVLLLKIGEEIFVLTENRKISFFAVSFCLKI